MDDHFEAVNRVHHLKECVGEGGNRELADNLVRDHEGICERVDCVCRNKGAVLMDVMIDPEMKMLKTSASNLIFRRNQFLKHFILAECELITEYFYRKINVTIMYLSALTEVGLYPRVMYESMVAEQTYSH